jgi:hypothetical protein
MPTPFEKIRPKITKKKCESCGVDDWEIVEDKNDKYPVVLFLPKAGNLPAPPPAIRVALMVCRNCRLTRTYLVPGETN